MLSSLRRRIFFMYSLLFVFILVVAVGLLNVYFSRSAADQAAAGLDVLAENISGQVHAKFTQMNRISIQIHFSQNILDAMKATAGWDGTGNYFDNHPDSSFVIQKDFLTILGMDITNTVVNLYNPGAFITTAQSSVDWPTIAQAGESGMVRQIEQHLDEKPYSAVLVGPHSIYWSGAADTSQYFSLSRRLHDSSAMRTLGVVQVLVPLKNIEALCAISDSSIHIFFLPG